MRILPNNLIKDFLDRLLVERQLEQRRKNRTSLAYGGLYKMPQCQGMKQPEAFVNPLIPLTLLMVEIDRASLIKQDELIM